MRDLIDLLQQLNEDQTLSPNAITKRSGRFEIFIDMIRKGDAFYNTKKEPVIIDPSEADRMQQLFDNGQFTGTLKLKTKSGDIIPLGSLLKAGKFGQASTGAEGETLSKEAVGLKPKEIGIADQDIPATKLANVLIANEALNSSEAGRAIIGMVKQLMAGQPAVIPEEVRHQKGMVDAIRDYGGEYLGVLALINGQSYFPRKDGFIQWLGADLSDLVINFPASSNTPLADSFASTIKNKKTAHTVNISSKGKGGGAPPSVSGLWKIPDEIRENPEYKTAVNFIDLCDLGEKVKGKGWIREPKYHLPPPRTVSVVFQAMNLIYQDVPDAIPKEFRPFLPWDMSIVQEVDHSVKMFKTKPVYLPKYQKLINMVQSDKASDGGKLAYVVKKAVMEAVNEKNAIPHFQDVVLAILDMNFVQQYADVQGKTGTMKFETQWPAKLEGLVTLDSKSGATDPSKGGFSFKLSKNSPKTDLPEPVEGAYADAEVKPANIRKTAAKIADGSKVKTGKDDEIGKISRRKR